MNIKSTVQAINNKKDVRMSHEDSPIHPFNIKVEVKKFVKKDKMNKINDELDEFSNLTSEHKLGV